MRETADPRSHWPGVCAQIIFAAVPSSRSENPQRPLHLPSQWNQTHRLLDFNRGSLPLGETSGSSFLVSCADWRGFLSFLNHFNTSGGGVCILGRERQC